MVNAGGGCEMLVGACLLWVVGMRGRRDEGMAMGPDMVGHVLRIGTPTKLTHSQGGRSPAFLPAIDATLVGMHATFLYQNGILHTGW